MKRTFDPAIPPILPNGEPDWGKMNGRFHGHSQTKKEILREVRNLCSFIREGRGDGKKRNLPSLRDNSRG